MDYLLRGMKYTSEHPDVLFTSGIMRCTNNTDWCIHPPHDLPIECMNVTPDFSWFKLGPFTYNQAEKILKRIDIDMDDCLAQFNCWEGYEI